MSVDQLTEKENKKILKLLSVMIFDKIIFIHLILFIFPFLLQKSNCLSRHKLNCYFTFLWLSNFELKFFQRVSITVEIPSLFCFLRDANAMINRKHKNGHNRSVNFSFSCFIFLATFFRNTNISIMPIILRFCIHANISFVLKCFSFFSIFRLLVKRIKALVGLVFSSSCFLEVIRPYSPAAIIDLFKGNFILAPLLSSSSFFLRFLSLSPFLSAQRKIGVKKEEKYRYD